MKKVIIGTFAKRNEDGSFQPSVPIYQEIDEREGEIPTPPYDELAELFYKKMKEANLIKRRYKPCAK